MTESIAYLNSVCKASRLGHERRMRLRSADTQETRSRPTGRPIPVLVRLICLPPFESRGVHKTALVDTKGAYPGLRKRKGCGQQSGGSNNSERPSGCPKGSH